jgi:hypothetical protein
MSIKRRGMFILNDSRDQGKCLVNILSWVFFRTKKKDTLCLVFLNCFQQTLRVPNIHFNRHFITSNYNYGWKIIS